MLDQSRDVSLVGGGEVTILPQGIDVEAMRTGGLGAMFFTIERARFLTRQALGGERYAGVVRTVAPAIEGKLLYLCPAKGRCRPTAVRAGGEIPSRAAALGAGLEVLEGGWSDSPADSAYVAPTPQQLYDEMDRFHLPRRADSTWGEWHYFNLVTGPDEWWYLTFLVGGEVSLTQRGDRWGGRMLVTHRRPDGRHDRYTADVPAARVAFDTAAADVAIGESFVRQRNGEYRLRAVARGGGRSARLDLTVRPELNRYFPPVELRDDEFLSGYVVPALAASAGGPDLRGRPLLGGERRPGLPRPQLGSLARRHLGMGIGPGRAPQPSVWRRLRSRAQQHVTILPHPRGLPRRAPRAPLRQDRVRGERPRRRGAGGECAQPLHPDRYLGSRHGESCRLRWSMRSRARWGRRRSAAYSFRCEASFGCGGPCWAARWRIPGGGSSRPTPTDRRGWGSWRPIGLGRFPVSNDRLLPAPDGRARRTLRSRARSRRGRDGDGLSREGPAPRPPRRDQGGPAGIERARRDRAIPPRDRARRAAPTSPHTPGLRLRHGGRRRGRPDALLRHAVRRGRDPARPAGTREAASGGRRDLARRRGRRRAGVRPRARRGAPRHQAREHPDERRARRGRRLRGGQGDRERCLSLGRGRARAHLGRFRHRNPALHGARAGHRAGSGRRQGRPIQPRRACSTRCWRESRRSPAARPSRSSPST